MTRPRLNPPRLHTDETHARLVRAAVPIIVEEAHGRVCGTCEHYARAFCACPKNYLHKHAAPLRIYRETATACKRWTEVK